MTMNFRMNLCFLCLCFLLNSHLLFASEISEFPESKFYQHLFQQQNLDHDVLFTKQFLQAVPPAKIDEILVIYKNTLGTYKQASGEGSTWELIFEKGKVSSRITLNEKGKVAGLWFGPPIL